MKKCVLLLMIISSLHVHAQSYEVQRLVLDLEKLSQLKTILSDLYKGYEVLDKGYQTIKSISEGNFNLHKAFLDGLLAVSPAVRDYQRVSDIINYEIRIVSQCSSALRRYRLNGHFTPDEISYFSSVFNQLLTESLQDISRLTDLLTASLLRMSDQERLASIDAIYKDTRNKYIFLRQFDNQATLFSLQHTSSLQEIKSTRQLYGLP